MKPNLALPPGLIAVQRVNSMAEFEQLGGFQALHPPIRAGDDPARLHLSLTLPDDEGRRTGRVGYSSKAGADAEGITGPTVVLVEAPGAPGPDTDPRLRRVTGGNGRALVATIGCQDLTIHVQLYFGPDPKPDEPFVTPHMAAVAQEFLDGINEQCAQ